MRLRSIFEPQRGGPFEFATVTELTDKGFKYSLDADVPLGPRYGINLKDGNEHLGIDGCAMYEPVL
jgi:hypothetical protein